jgi:hypothetical protein
MLLPRLEAPSSGATNPVKVHRQLNIHGYHLRSLIADHRDSREIFGWIVGSCLNENAVAGVAEILPQPPHPQSGRAYADRHHGFREPAGISRTWNFSAVA